MKKVSKIIGIKFLIIITLFSIWFIIYERKGQIDERTIKDQTIEKQIALDAIDMLIWEKDTNDILLFVNKAYERRVLKNVFGDTVEREMFYGIHCDSIFGSEVNAMFSENDETVYRLEKTLDFLEFGIQIKHGKIDTTWFESRKYPIYNHDSLIIGIGGIAKIK